MSRSLMDFARLRLVAMVLAAVFAFSATATVSFATPAGDATVANTNQLKKCKKIKNKKAQAKCKQKANKQKPTKPSKPTK